MSSSPFKTLQFDKKSDSAIHPAKTRGVVAGDVGWVGADVVAVAVEPVVVGGEEPVFSVDLSVGPSGSSSVVVVRVVAVLDTVVRSVESWLLLLVFETSAAEVESVSVVDFFVVAVFDLDPPGHSEGIIADLL